MDEKQTSAGPVAAWGRATRHLTNSVLEANRAARAALGFESGDRRRVEGVQSTTHDRVDWTVERSVERQEDVAVGDTVRFGKDVADEDVRAFAEVSGDTNRLHLDDEFAEGTRFDGRIVHGTLVSSLISAALARVPGLTIYLSQDVEFHRPARVGDRLTGVVEVVEDLGDDQYRLTTDVLNEADEELVTGEAVVLLDDLPADDREA